MISKVVNISIDANSTILQGLKKMDQEGVKSLIVYRKEIFLGMLTIGDIQRAIIKGLEVTSSIDSIVDSKKIYASEKDEIEVIKKKMYSLKAECMPVVSNEGKLIDVYFWRELFGVKQSHTREKIDLPVVIMAGGKGSRLRPLTNVLPKPLIPIGDQTILEDIMDRFTDVGCHDFYLSVNYKADFIIQYLDNLNNPQYRLSYFREEKPLGTAGSLHLLKDKINTTFFVSNCDIIIDEDYSQILNYHRQNENEITVVAAIKNYPIPYGTLETGSSGRLQSLQEKPDITFKINTGMYILEPHLINEIPENVFFHITYLIEKLIKEDRKVGVFPINEGSWTDIGNWEEYRKYTKE